MEDAAEDEDGANSDITPRERSTSQLGWYRTVRTVRMGRRRIGYESRSAAPWIYTWRGSQWRT